MLRIDRETGVVSLGAIELRAGMTPADFAELPGFRRMGSLGTSEWYGETQIEGFNLTTFFDSVRLSSINLRRSGVSDSASKDLNDVLLRELLGPEAEAKPIGPKWGLFAPPVRQEPWLSQARNLVWPFAWGEAVSWVEPRDWIPMISVKWSR